MVVMKSGRLMRKIFAAVLSLSLVLASAVSVSAAKLADPSTGNNYESTDEIKTIQIYGLGGIYNVSQDLTFNAIIPEGFTKLTITNNGEEIANTIESSSTANNYRITLEANDIKYIGENLIKIVATYDGGITITGSKMMHTYPKMLSTSSTSFTTQINQDFEGLTGFNECATVADKATKIIGSGRAKSITMTYDDSAVNVTDKAISNDILGKTGNNVLKLSGKSTDIRFMQIAPSFNGAQILNFNVYLYGDKIGLFDVMFNAKAESTLSLTGLKKGMWHDVAVVFDHKSGIMTTYIDGTENVVPITSTAFGSLRIRTNFTDDDQFVAIDNLSLKSCLGKVPGVDKIQYYSDTYETRSEATNAVVPNGSKGLVVSLTRGTGGNTGAFDRVDSDGNVYFNVYKNGENISDEITCWFRKDTASTAEWFIYDIYRGDSKAFEPGKYTVEFTDNATLVNVPMSGKLIRNFYVTSEDGAVAIPGESTYDGKTFNYNMEYGLVKANSVRPQKSLTLPMRQRVTSAVTSAVLS